MHLHRLTTQNLPSIRIHDHNSFADPSSDHHSPATSQRSMPREIPIPKLSLGSPAHGPPIPPILSLEPPAPLPPPPPPPLLPPSSSSSSDYHFRRPGSPGSAAADDNASSGGLWPRRVVLNIRNREQPPPPQPPAPQQHQHQRQRWRLSPMSRSNSVDEPEFPGVRDGFSVRSEDSDDRNWREAFYSSTADVQHESVSLSFSFLFLIFIFQPLTFLAKPFEHRSTNRPKPTTAVCWAN